MIEREVLKTARDELHRLVFEKDECGPDDDLKLQFEAVSRLNAEEKNVIR